MSVRRLLAAVALLFVGVVLLASVAEAQADETEVFGTLIDQQGTGDFDDDEPIEGARIVVRQDGNIVGEAETDEEGKYRIALPGEGTYTATLDEDSLPDGVSIADGGDTIDLFMGPGQSRVLLFPLNAAGRVTEGRLDLVLQSMVDGAYFGLLLALSSVGLSLIYGTTGLVNFAHGELVTLGAIFAYFFNRTVGVHLVLAGVLAVVAAAGCGWLLDAGFWGPLRRRGTGNISQMVISIGLAMAALNLYLYFFGGLTRPYSDYHAQRAWALGTIDLPPKKAIAGLLCLASLVLVATALQRTRTGKAMRAISDNPDLASSSGINVDRVIRLVWLFGAALAALGGILFSISEDVNHEQGSSMLLLLFAAITLGGLGAAYGALIGGFVIGLFVIMSSVWIPSELKNVGALVVLILVLLVRPQGILGQKERVPLMDWGLIFRASGQAAFGPDAVYFALAAIGLNVQFGYTGLLNFGQAGFAAAGAYGLAVAVITYGLSFWAGLAIGLTASIVLALVLGFPTLRLRTDYLAIVTIAASEIIRLVVRSVRYTATLGGTDGLQGFGARFFELNPIDGGIYTPLRFRPDQVWLLVWAWPLVGLCCLITFMLMRSPWGRVIKGIREDEDAVRSLGKNVYWYKMQSLMLGGVFGALAGIVFAMSKQSVNPDDYATRFTFTALAVLILGGTARIIGPVVGAVLFIGGLQLFDTFLRQAIHAGYVPDWLPVDQTKVGIIRLILVGTAIILLMVFRPQGILGDRREVAIRDG